MKPLQILVLTDFSPLASVALRYAARMSHSLDVEYTLLNVVRFDGLPKTNFRMKTIEKTMVEEAQNEGQILIKELQKESKTGVKIKFVTKKGHTVNDVVKRYVQQNPTGLVVMGTQGASSLKKFRLGGTAVSVIETCPVPVLVIPKWATFKNFEKVVYATDLKNTKKELDTLLPFASIFKSHLLMVHVVESMDKKVELKKMEAEKLIGASGYKNIWLRVLLDNNIAGAIDGFFKDTKADLLTTFTHELSLYEKLFGLSVTRKLAYQANIPLLTFKRKAKI